MEKERLKKALSNLYVVRMCCLDNKSHISNNQEINDLETQRSKTLYPVLGYWIFNGGKDDVEIIVPHYTQNATDLQYYGVEKKIVLQPKKTEWMPTKYFVALLLENDLKCANGHFDAKSYNEKALELKDYDAVLNSFPFVFDDDWKELGDSISGVFQMGLVVFDGEHGDYPVGWLVTEEDNGIFQNRFGYLNNKFYQDITKKNIKGKKVSIEEKEYKTKDGAKILAGILNIDK